MQKQFDDFKLKVEAILFTADAPLGVSEIRTWMGEDVTLSDIRMAIRALSREYENRAFQIEEKDNRFQIRTKDDFLDVIKKQYSHKPRPLSKSSLETLSLIAYRQPVTKAQINAIRQHDSTSLIHSLRDKELIYAAGQRKEAGNPVEYRTTDKFLQVFGLKSLAHLPNIRSLQSNLDEQKMMSQALKISDEQSNTAATINETNADAEVSLFPLAETTETLESEVEIGIGIGIRIESKETEAADEVATIPDTTVPPPGAETIQVLSNKIEVGYVE